MNCARISAPILALTAFLGCSSDGERQGYVLGNGKSTTGSTNTNTTGEILQTTGTGGTTGTASSSMGTTAGLVMTTTTAGGGSGTTGSPTCATESTAAELLPVYLVFGFDRSGSMGQLDYEWHDPALKWDPVSLATQTFFNDPNSTGFNASLTFFPREGMGERCAADTYLQPDVPMTALPSTAFADALNQVPNEEWIGGTPSLAVLEALISYAQEQAQSNPGRYAIVLVTDGYPQGCDNVTVQAVADTAAAVAAEVPTYVIGIANPPIDGAPETVQDLQQIAVAGGTEQAFLIDTGDAAATSAAFSAAVEQIRGSAIACELGIPEPPDGAMFDKEKVAVTYTSGATGIPDPLVYDPDCATERGWHYDDPAAPSLIQLCDATCELVEADPTAALGVDFVCEAIIEIPE